MENCVNDVLSRAEESMDFIDVLLVRQQGLIESIRGNAGPAGFAAEDGKSFLAEPPRDDCGGVEATAAAVPDSGNSEISGASEIRDTSEASESDETNEASETNENSAINETSDSKEKGEAAEEAEPPKKTITEKQLRAMGRKHLLLMIRDLEKELAQLKG